MLQAEIAEMAQKYREGQCLYCMKPNRLLVPLQCGLKHKYCVLCFTHLTRITRVKKGLVNRFLYQDAIKCPQCQEIILI